LWIVIVVDLVLTLLWQAKHSLLLLLASPWQVDESRSGFFSIPFFCTPIFCLRHSS
jgi:hypothetical protein